MPIPLRQWAAYLCDSHKGSRGRWLIRFRSEVRRFKVVTHSTSRTLRWTLRTGSCSPVLVYKQNWVATCLAFPGHIVPIGMVYRIPVFLLSHRFAGPWISRFPGEGRQDDGFVHLGRHRKSLVFQTGHQFLQIMGVSECPAVILVDRLQCLLCRLLRVEAQVLVECA